MNQIEIQKTSIPQQSHSDSCLKKTFSWIRQKASDGISCIQRNPATIAKALLVAGTIASTYWWNTIQNPLQNMNPTIAEALPALALGGGFGSSVILSNWIGSLYKKNNEYKRDIISSNGNRYRITFKCPENINNSELKEIDEILNRTIIEVLQNHSKPGDKLDIVFPEKGGWFAKPQALKNTAPGTKIIEVSPESLKNQKEAAELLSHFRTIIASAGKPCTIALQHLKDAREVYYSQSSFFTKRPLDFYRDPKIPHLGALNTAFQELAASPDLLEKMRASQNQALAAAAQIYKNNQSIINLEKLYKSIVKDLPTNQKQDEIFFRKSLLNMIDVSAPFIQSPLSETLSKEFSEQTKNQFLLNYTASRELEIEQPETSDFNYTKALSSNKMTFAYPPELLLLNITRPPKMPESNRKNDTNISKRVENKILSLNKKYICNGETNIEYELMHFTVDDRSTPEDCLTSYSRKIEFTPDNKRTDLYFEHNKKSVRQITEYSFFKAANRMTTSTFRQKQMNVTKSTQRIECVKKLSTKNTELVDAVVRPTVFITGSTQPKSTPLKEINTVLGPLTEHAFKLQFDDFNALSPEQQEKLQIIRAYPLCKKKLTALNAAQELRTSVRKVLDHASKSKIKKLALPVLISDEKIYDYNSVWACGIIAYAVKEWMQKNPHACLQSVQLLDNKDEPSNFQKAEDEIKGIIQNPTPHSTDRQFELAVEAWTKKIPFKNNQ